MKTLILVVLYNKRLEKSKTLNSLGKVAGEGFSLLIVNNGPSDIREDDDFILNARLYIKELKLQNFIHNKPLSHIYNDVIDQYPDFDRYVLLDDDTEITSSFLNSPSIDSKDLFVIVPKIIDSNTGLNSYPQVNKTVYKGDDGFLPTSEDVLSIGSGVIIYKKTIEIFNNLGVKLFNENYALYGVDMSFFRTINSINKNTGLIRIYVKGSLIHEMSSTSGEVSAWRKTERLYDELLTYIYYSKSTPSKFFNLGRLLCKELLRLRLTNFYKAILVLFTKKHPRC